MYRDQASALAELNTEYEGLFPRPARYAKLDQRGARRVSPKSAQTRLRLAQEALAAEPNNAQLQRECDYWKRLIEIYEHFDQQHSSNTRVMRREFKSPPVNAKLARALHALINSEKYKPLSKHSGALIARVTVTGVRTPMPEYVKRILSSADDYIAAAATEEERAYEELRKEYWREVLALYEKYPVQKPSSKSA